MLNSAAISKITLPVEGIALLQKEARAEGYDFLERLLDEWASGANRFDRPGEVLMGCFSHRELIGMGGLTIDPYAGSSHVGRIRRVYIRAEWRNRGAGGMLVRKLVEKAREGFRCVRLRAENTDAARLYERLGFEPILDPHATHWMNWSAGITSL
ncbi:MAG TPA: GNAT family N-acetyltransferase [Acidobacteriaceae bacterium]